MIGPPDSPKTLKKSQNSLQKEHKEQCEKIEQLQQEAYCNCCVII